ncbi:hypothetical protein HMPREF6485_1891 [Segatella buccae ATCC 33574]|uniref:Uncharacterized protein n=1 Tax=Segatella buccae ATCC 33574 TaxID=873513 RepID=E6K8F5_9BACT|nr:hypothetical protein HMPREF6485_1891 [Segatella buccae ATCC 33574]
MHAPRLAAERMVQGPCTDGAKASHGKGCRETRKLGCRCANAFKVEK